MECAWYILYGLWKFDVHYPLREVLIVARRYGWVCGCLPFISGGIVSRGTLRGENMHDTWYAQSTECSGTAVSTSSF